MISQLGVHALLFILYNWHYIDDFSYKKNKNKAQIKTFNTFPRVMQSRAVTNTASRASSYST